MRRTSTALGVLSPICCFCGRSWLPEEGVAASQTYCHHCAEERRAAALKAFGGRASAVFDPSGAYLLPRHLQPSRFKLSRKSLRES